ncbi:hypothetical protein THRCLA_22298 [Thraustotheca clavata]|uniref:Uncharacterized protein n=1 Tax=Thraustotheca clavata TaxID=74557 RepID=A0A1V9Z6X9_9STRA|nr:hypothetical protein THRCLA_22298 [Thraustotheca clavata]
MDKRSVVLRPALEAIKQRAEVALAQRKGDVVVFSNQLDKERRVGLTDVSFEHRKTSKQVSLYFTSNADGIAAYKHVASKVAQLEGVDLQFTPQFGQSRISFSWDSFWVHADQLKVLSSNTEDDNDSKDPTPPFFLPSSSK